MGIGSGSGIGGSAQPPTILETEGQAFHESNKKFVLAMLPADTLEVIPFTNREEQMVWKYDATPNHPALHPLLSLRMSTEEADTDDTSWKQHLEQLIETLPAEIKEILIAENKKPFLERSLSYIVLSNILLAVAKSMGWVDMASVAAPLGSTAATQNDLNALLPYVALRGGIDQAMSILNDTQGYLDGLGANFVYYDKISHAMSEITSSMTELNQLRAEIEKETIKEEVKAQIVRVAHDIGNINPLLSRENQGNEFQILGSLSNALAVVSSAFALNSESASLLVGLHIATTGLRTEDSGTGVLGSSFSSIIDSVVKGLLGNLSFGTGAELAELNELKGDLYELLK